MPVFYIFRFARGMCKTRSNLYMNETGKAQIIEIKGDVGIYIGMFLKHFEWNAWLPDQMLQGY